MPKPDSFVVVALLTLLVAFGALSTDLYLPSLPTLVTAFDTDIATVQLTLSMFLAGFAVSQLVLGPLSDRFGRRPVLMLGMAIFVASSIFCALATSIEALILGRFFQAFGASCGPVLGRAVVRDVYGRERAAQVLAYMAMAMAVAPMVGPVIGGFLTSLFGWPANFWALAGVGTVAGLGVLLLLQETNRHKDPTATRPAFLVRNYAALLRHRLFLGYALAVAWAYGGLFAFISGSSHVFMGPLGLTEVQFGLAFACTVSGYMVGGFLSGRLTLRVGLTRMIGIGGLICLGSGLAILIQAATGLLTVPGLVAGFFLYLVGSALVLPNAMAGGVAPFPTMAGLASALLGFFQMAFAAFLGIAVGLMADPSGLSMAAAIALGGLGVVLTHRWAIVPAERLSPPPSGN